MDDNNSWGSTFLPVARILLVVLVRFVFFHHQPASQLPPPPPPLLCSPANKRLILLSTPTPINRLVLVLPKINHPLTPHANCRGSTQGTSNLTIHHLREEVTTLNTDRTTHLPDSASSSSSSVLPSLRILRIYVQPLLVGLFHTLALASGQKSLSNRPPFTRQRTALNNLFLSQ